MKTWRETLARDIARSRRVAIMGIGNTGRGDDAAGVLVARELLAGPAGSGTRTLVLVTEEAPENFTGTVRSFGPDLVILVDASSGLGPSGTVSLVDPDRVADDDVGVHRIPLGLIVSYIRETFGCRVRILGIEPGHLEPARAVSSEVTEAIDDIVEFLESVLG